MLILEKFVYLHREYSHTTKFLSIMKIRFKLSQVLSDGKPLYMKRNFSNEPNCPFNDSELSFFDLFLSSVVPTVFRYCLHGDKSDSKFLNIQIRFEWK